MVLDLFDDIHRLLEVQSRVGSRSRMRFDLGCRAREIRILDRMARLVRLDENTPLLLSFYRLVYMFDMEILQIVQGMAA